VDQLLQTIFAIADNGTALFWLMFAASLANTFFPPIPIEFATVFAGYLVSAGHGDIPVIISATVAGMTLGSVAVYYLARIYGTPLFARPPFDRIVKKDTYDRAAAWFEAYGIGTLFLAKFVPGMNFVAIVCAGILRFGQTKAVAGIFASNLFVFALLAFIGKTAGERWQDVYRLLGKAGGVIAVVVILLLLALLFFRSRIKK
jgi:membrane protein DedA with SNARE-associated domain